MWAHQLVYVHRAGHAYLNVFASHVCVHFSNGIASRVCMHVSQQKFCAFLVSRYHPLHLHFYFALFLHPWLSRPLLLRSSVPPSGSQSKGKAGFGIRSSVFDRINSFLWSKDRFNCDKDWIAHIDLFLRMMGSICSQSIFFEDQLDWFDHGQSF